MSEKKTSVQGGIGGATLLGIVFITLKLTGHIDWSWIWVTCPLWAGFALVLTVLACMGLFLGAIALFELILAWRER